MNELTEEQRAALESLRATARDEWHVPAGKVGCAYCRAILNSREEAIAHYQAVHAQPQREPVDL